MPDTRKHRGAHPDDARLFRPENVAILRRGVEEFSWLLTQGYAERSALALVGNRHGLTQRQRTAVRRCACSDTALAERTARRIPASECEQGRIVIDGYNVLITLESALAGGVILVGRDGCIRDLASLHGTYRRVEETLPALRLIARHIQPAGIRTVDCLLDRPVSNSARLRQLILGEFAAGSIRWEVQLVDHTDDALADRADPIATSDSAVLDRCGPWVGLAGEIVSTHVPRAWIVDLGSGQGSVESPGGLT